ncbi:DUF3793 family protein [Chlorobium phaeobacteroides]|jgi:hypothetical protein|uniref:DUF3793 family protein n=1 Tax=Chlorobium phaeobacteroides (strain DSM 266 / SMG 266 / 2430) TaxID=290317 RepID=A1BDA0_CHLPD|nr:DUF3793 family protein [Chlorobium phaeobacteroides]ABL64377.1 conserved hypothetical protein [Chlorobium phaeobacteroides DSM 266]MBV5320007.1 DUF3793 family protein [Chlorobium phaeobacteroides]
MQQRFSKNQEQKLSNWRRRLNTQKKSEVLFEHWLFMHTAAVLFAGKPGELLILKRGLFGLLPEETLESIDSFCSSLALQFNVLLENEHSIKVIFYNEVAVDRRIGCIPKKILHCNLRYPFGLRSESFLKELGRRWLESGTTPHEIGIVLGYPLKDVWGFMGISSDPCSGSCGWRIYGNPLPSLKKRTLYNHARTRAETYLRAA